MILMNNIRENNYLLNSSPTSRVLCHNTAALQEELYLCMGKMTALSMVVQVSDHSKTKHYF